MHTALLSVPVHKRPRERLSLVGSDKLDLTELLAVILSTGRPDCSVLQLAERVRPLLHDRVTLDQLLQVPGIGRAKASRLLAALQLPARLRDEQSVHIVSPQDIFTACQDLVWAAKEYLVCFSVGARGQLVHRGIISVGTATASLVHPREVFRTAIQENAVSIALAHNHPSHDPTPSQADREITRQLVQAGKVLGIQLLDHVVCAANGFTSLKLDSPQLFW